MSKIMLVEDDNNLREIYEARLLAEGYEIITAHDGEEALALAVKEKPDLIISDVMMPKISGFDMLDILRSTPETKNTKVIMMTALSQSEDKDRADKLGADRYLVKSQVTLEDVAKIAREVLEDGSAPATPATAPAPAIVAPVAVAPVATTPDPLVVAPIVAVAAVAPVLAAPVVAAPAPAPVAAAPAAVAAPAPAIPAAPTPDPTPVVAPTLDAVSNAQTSAGEQATLDAQINQFIGVTSDTPAVTPAPVATAMSEKVIQPIAQTPPDLAKLVEAEERKNLQTGDIVKPDVPAGDDPNLIAL